jgi:hypothetical protein
MSIRNKERQVGETRRRGSKWQGKRNKENVEE